ncbi:SIS domain-containing protein [Chlamydia sp. 17-3921]|uniref:KpsF/GutQ family sugar-phosphate isomerase n=1 Tax=Chlamydia sp. 17-3921 TaxID=2675798 RepID=UPI00191B3C56|nr:KpsF/GutQ family sugar-phosphate isomerase [Chlamydia sp. 17-3921]
MSSSVVITDLCQEILSKQKEAVDAFFSSFQCENSILLVEKILKHSGWIFFSGVGKSGHIARKVVATLQSLSERALFLSHGDMLHGDLGLVQDGDIVCFFSKSGETQELLKCVPYLKEREITLVAVTSSPYSSLAVLADHVIILPLVPELDPFNLIPTTSTLYQMLFGDLLSMLLLHGRGVTLSTYGKNHPSGQIGLKAQGRVYDYMFPKTEVPFCSRYDSVSVALETFSAYGCGCVCIVSSNFELLGIFTDGDLRRALSQYGGDVLSLSLEKIMTKNPRIIEENADVATALQVMEAKNPITVLPVVDNENSKFVVGLLHVHTLAKAGLL